MIEPRPLTPGARIHVIAPSGPFDRTLVLRAIGWLGQRYRVSFNRDMFERKGFLAGSDERRRDELSSALCDPSLSAIATARGGHGLLRIAHSVPWGQLLKSPKWLVGFSDPTAIHAELWKLGLVSLHAANVAGLGRADAKARADWIHALEHPEQPRCLHGTTLVKGRACGTLVGGNLTVLTMLAASQRLSLPDGCILAIEDVSETSYRIDRMLSALRAGGYFDRVAGFALGEFTDCGSGIAGVPASKVLEDGLCHFRPVVGDLPFGHGRRNQPLYFGRTATLDGASGTLSF